MGLKDHCQVAPEGPREAVKKRGTIHIHTTESRAWGSGECALRCAFEFHSSCSILPVTPPICVLSSSHLARQRPLRRIAAPSLPESEANASLSHPIATQIFAAAMALSLAVLSRCEQARLGPGAPKFGLRPFACLSLQLLPL